MLPHNYEFIQHDKYSKIFDLLQKKPIPWNPLLNKPKPTLLKRHGDVCKNTSATPVHS